MEYITIIFFVFYEMSYMNELLFSLARLTQGGLQPISSVLVFLLSKGSAGVGVGFPHWAEGHCFPSW